VPGVVVKEGESIDSALRRFRNICRCEHIQEDFKRAQRYEKPSEKKRRKIKESEKRRARRERKNRN